MYQPAKRGLEARQKFIKNLTSQQLVGSPIVCFFVLAFFACTGSTDNLGGPPITAVPVANVTVSLPHTNPRVGETLQAAALALDASGAVLSGRAVTWESTANDVASVSAGGLVTAVSPGTATIRATAEGKSGSIVISVTPVPVTSVSLDIGVGSVVVGGTLQATATPKDSLGRPLIGRTASWTSQDPTILTVSNSGLVLGRKAGAANVTASVDGVVASSRVTILNSAIASISVLPDSVNLLPGTGQQLVVVVRDVVGDVVPNPTLVWVTDETKLTVSQGGLLLPKAGSGRTVVTVSAGGKSAQVVVRLLTFNRLRTGTNRTCGITIEDALYCWGQNLGGLRGDGTFGDALNPSLTTNTIVFDQLTVGGPTCGIASTGTSYCWGDNSVGQLGTGRGSGSSRLPVAVTGSVQFVTIDAGFTHVCAVAKSAQAYCWGGDGPQLGQGRIGPPQGNLFDPTPVVGAISFVGIAAGFDHTCGWTASGNAYCWGDNRRGQLGTGGANNTSSFSDVPVPVAGNLSFALIDAGEKSTCGITVSSKAYCWGAGLPGFSTLPFAVLPGADVSTISVGGTHACLITTAGKAYCFGNNDFGQLGVSDGFSNPLPTPVSGDLIFTGIRAGSYHTCGLLSGSGAAVCWGLGAWGQIGDGTMIQKHLTPTTVRGSP